MKIYTVTTYYKVGRDYKVYKKEQAVSKDTAVKIRNKFKEECDKQYLGSIILATNIR